jgi:transcription initiation factor TFIID subunit 2
MAMIDNDSGPAPAQEAAPSYSVAHQVVDLDVDFKARRVSGKTEITIHPQSKDLKTITLNLRQCRITRLTVNGKSVSRMQYIDPYTENKLAGEQTAHQHHLLSSKLATATKIPPNGELTIDVPRSIHIEELNLNTISSNQTGLLRTTNGDAPGSSLVESTQVLTDVSIARFTPLIINVGFSTDDVRDGVHFVAHGMVAGRFPHAYTPKTNVPGSACCIFPCMEGLNARCTWDINIKVPRTVGDAIRGMASQEAIDDGRVTNRVSSPPRAAHEEREMIVVCSGEDAGRTEDKQDASKTIFSFSCMSILSAQQIGFAIGPFEEIKLSDFRVPEDDVGQNAVEVLGYCLPGRSDELRNTCLPTVRAIDFITKKYVACPFKTYRMCFVDDLHYDTTIAGALTICSNRLLYPADIIDTAEEVTRTLVHAIASQWVGINIVPYHPTDSWIVIGIAHYIAETFMKDLCGNNEYRSRMKVQADRVCDMDHNRPSLFDLGTMLEVDPLELEFMSLKAPLVLFILDRRIAKVVGLPKMPAIISKILLRARKGELTGNALSTELFQRTCERFYHNKIDDFLNQWVRGGGCPHFRAFQKFNKKKLVVEMMIRQVQGEYASRDLQPDTFMRDVREELHNIWAAPVQNVFTGPITIRVHEADGTPYEHVVEIREAQMRFEIPYNTKYKRLKRSRRQREKNFIAAAANADPTEGESDALLYCLGDVLQSEEETRRWRISEWTPEDEEKMSSESYEWIRVDADFEWICKMDLNMVGYMYASQLQQDRDVVAQMDAVQAISNYPPSPLISSIYLRTVMDKRYFHRIRTAAAMAMMRQATQDTDYIGFWHLRKAFEELYCLSEGKSTVARPNNFADLAAYQLQCGLIRAISKVRDAKGIAPPQVIEFLLDKLKFNNNDTNPVRAGKINTIANMFANDHSSLIASMSRS